MNTVNIRYIVRNMDAAVDFYTKHLEFEVAMRPAPGFAALRHGMLRLLLNEPGAGGAGQSLRDGSTPEPGGWNRIQIEMDQLENRAEQLKKAGVTFRSGIISGKGGKQVLVEDPSGNPVELFEPYRK